MIKSKSIVCKITSSAYENCLETTTIPNNLLTDFDTQLETTINELGISNTDIISVNVVPIVIKNTCALEATILYNSDDTV